MKIAICVNHSYPHCGGSEKVVQQISESMVGWFGHSCTVVSKSLKEPLRHNGVNYVPCPGSTSGFLKTLSDISPDVVLVYSDCFVYWPDILEHCEKIKATKFIVPVGMNQMLAHKQYLKKFIKNQEHFHVITHSDNYADYQQCERLGIPVTIIPNGVDLTEFDNSEFDFKSKYDIGDKKLVLCVSNFFPGKGQDHLVKVLQRLKNKRDDFVAVLVSTHVNFTYAQILSRRVKQLMKAGDIPHKFLENLPREEVVGAFVQADVFAFPSQKEVAPLVVLECMAARTPWVAMKVGNVPQLAGGIVVPGTGKDRHGYLNFGNVSYDQFSNNINEILDSAELGEKLKKEGRELAENIYNWDIIAEQYNSIFRQKHETTSC